MLRIPTILFVAKISITVDTYKRQFVIKTILQEDLNSLKGNRLHYLILYFNNAFLGLAFFKMPNFFKILLLLKKGFLIMVVS